jgi:hypothetical protein
LTKLDGLVRTYIQVREKKVTLKAEYEARNAEFTALQDKIEALMLAKFAEMGVDSVKTPHGTAYSQVQTRASLADWDTFKVFCQQQDDPFEFLERRISKAAVEQYKQDRNDLPPGVNWAEVRVVNFRRS